MPATSWTLSQIYLEAHPPLFKLESTFMTKLELFFLCAVCRGNLKAEVKRMTEPSKCICSSWAEWDFCRRIANRRSSVLLWRNCPGTSKDGWWILEMIRAYWFPSLLICQNLLVSDSALGGIPLRAGGDLAFWNDSVCTLWKGVV